MSNSLFPHEIESDIMKKVNGDSDGKFRKERIQHECYDKRDCGDGGSAQVYGG